MVRINTLDKYVIKQRCRRYCLQQKHINQLFGQAFITHC